MTSLDAAREAVETLREIIAAEASAERDYMIDDFIRAIEPLSKAIGATLCREKKLDRNTYFDESVQAVRETVAHLVKEATENPDLLDEIHNFRGFVTYRARSAMTRHLDSSAGLNQASGMAGMKRRIKEMERTRAAMYAELGREPSDFEIVEKTNERMRATRRDAARQGMICSVEDLQIAHATVESIDDVTVQHVAKETVETDSELHSVEKVRLVITCIQACDQESAQLGAIARLWFKPALEDDYDAHPSAAEIARELGIEPSTARTKVTRVRSIAQRVARERWGIRREEREPA